MQNDFEKHGNKAEPEFIRLYLDNNRRIYGFILAIVPNWSDADDIFQETTRVMWSKFNQFQAGTNFLQWSLTIARFQVMNFLKQKKRNQLHLSNEVVESLADRMTLGGPKQDLVRNALEKCIAKLEKRDRFVLKMRYENNERMENLAKQLGVKLNAAYKSVSRIHNLLFYCIRRSISMEESL